MDLLKYVIVGIASIIVGIILAILVRNIIAGIGFVILLNAIYILWNYFNSVKKDVPPPQSSTPPAQDN